MSRLFVALLSIIVSISGALASSASELRALVLTGSIPPITDAQKKLDKVEFAPEAPAVLLLNQRQDTWELRGSQNTHSIEILRRVKILTPAGVEKHGDYTLKLFGDVRPEILEARTVLPDGTIVKADDQYRRSSTETGRVVLSVAFPKVQVGAILDVHLTLLINEGFGFWVDPFYIQDELPVVDSRYVLMPATGLVWTPAFQFTPALEPQRVKLTGQRECFMWSWHNVEPLVMEPNQPSVEGLLKTLYVRSLSYVGSYFSFDIGSDWNGYAKWETEYLDYWVKQGHAAADQFAAAAVAGKTDPLEKAEALRVALRSKVQVAGIGEWGPAKSPDDVLARGKTWSGQLATAAVAMLRSAGVQADVLATRHRTDGPLPAAFPLPVLIQDRIVRINTPGGPVFWAPGSDLKVGVLPASLRGVLAMPINKTATEPVQTPPVTVKDWVVTRAVTGKLDVSGRVEAQTVARYQGGAAETWRRRLRDADDAARKEALQRDLRRNVPTAEVGEIKFENVDDDAKELVVTTNWTADNAATLAGERLVLKPSFYARIPVEDWPATTRHQVIDLKTPYEFNDTVELAMPDGVREVGRPSDVRVNVTNLGQIEAFNYSYTKKVVLKRHVRLDNSVFDASAYPTIRDFFSRIAAFDDAPTLIRLVAPAAPAAAAPVPQKTE